MKVLSRISLVLVFVWSSATMVASDAPAGNGGPLLKARDLEADAAVLRHAYQQLHPGLYRYHTKARMDANFATLNRQLNHDQTLGQAFVAFSQFAAKVSCGHTQANPFNQPKTVVEALFKSPTRVPFYFAWLKGHMIVTRDFTPERALPVGTEIVKLNGVPAATILARLMSVARADGANDAKRIAQLEVSGDSSFETFDLYYPMFFPNRSARDTLVVIRPHSNKTEVVLVDPLTFEERIAPIREREGQRKGGNAALFEWRDLAGGIAYLRMPTWALYNSKWNWKDWLDAHLDDAAGRRAPALIIDLRGNEGGDDVGNEILPRLIDAPITLSSMRRLVRYRKVPEELAPYLDTWDKSFFDWKDSAVDMPEPWPTAPAGVSYLRLTRFDDNAGGDVVKPAGKRFHGKVVVLIDANNSSATFQFARAIQSHGLGTLIGEPTGGSQRGINGGAFFFVRLPHSGIEMDLPLVGTFPESPAPDAGVTPDVPVERTAADIAAGNDVALALAMKVIGNQ